MSSVRRPPGHIHKIREFELEKIHLADEFDILQIVGEGWFGKILLVEHRATDTEMVLKALPKPYVSLRDFYREFHYGLHLGVHKNIVTTYDVAFETAGFYVFTQEYAPLGDLTSNISESGIGELHSKRVAKQIASALDYMHSKDIVHRDVKLDNVLIYRSDFSRVKLCDFGESFKSGTVVERRNEWLPYSPPEVLDVKPEDTYKADPSHDTWQFGIVIFVCLTGCLPWQKAATDDPRYSRYLSWHATNVMLPLRRTPKLFKLLSSKAAKMFKKFLEPKLDRRPKNLSDLSKFIDDRWLTKGAEKDLAENEQDELCPSMYSFHSCPEEKNKLLSTLAEHGIETTVDRNSKKARIRDWIESSVITEEDEEEDSGTGTPSSSVSREPVAGHISSVKAEEAIKKINTTIKDASNKHFDPRTGAVQQGPSAMGTIFKNSSIDDNMTRIGNTETSANAAISTISTTNGKNSSFNSGSLITLASRNDLIMSEGQSYYSELNLNMIDETTADQKMVNSRLNIPSNSYIEDMQNLQIANSQTDFTNFNVNNKITTKIDSTTTTTTTNNNSSNNKYNNSSNNLTYLNKNVDQLNRKYFSSLALSNYNSDNTSYNYNNNSNNTIQFKGSNYQSIATISVSETSQPSIQRMHTTNQNENIQHESNDHNTTNIKSFNSHHNHNINNNSKITEEASRYFTNSNNNGNSNNNKYSTDSKLSSTIHNHNHNHNDALPSSPPISLSSSSFNKYKINNINNTNNVGNDKIQHQTMKDTPYDYIKVKRNVTNNYGNNTTN